MYYIYILYSSLSDKFYVGYTNDPDWRVIEHNTSPRITYTSKYRLGQISAVFECSTVESGAMRIEKLIKKQKNRGDLLKN
jgi:putative endonuclease